MKHRTLISLLLAAVLLLASCSGDPSGKDDTAVTTGTAATTVGDTDDPGDTDDFVTVLRFAVASDIHVTDTDCTSAGYLAKLFSSAYAYAEGQEYDTLDAAVFVGDITEIGEKGEYEAFNTVIEENIREETVFIPLSGNHDVPYGGIKNFIALYGEETDTHAVVKGYHFIGVSNLLDSNYARSVDWLESELESAAADAPERPIFTFQHHHMPSTVYSSRENSVEGAEEMDALYSKYPQVINFSGHSHAPINTPGSVYQKNYTLFGTGTLYYLGVGGDVTNRSTVPGTRPAAQFYIVEVSEAGSVRVLPYDLLTDSFFTVPGTDRQLVYSIEDPFDKSTWLYTDEVTSKSAAPVFADDAAITVKSALSTTALISIPQASDDECVYSYSITCTPAEGETLRFSYYSDFFIQPMPETLDFPLGGLAPATEYAVSVVPVDAYGKIGDPLTGTLTTAAAPAEYTANGEVNHVGTFNSFDSIDSVTLATTNPAYGKFPDGDVFIGTLHSAVPDGGATAEIVEGGWNGTSALAFSSSVKDEMEMHFFATDENASSTLIPDGKYLRVWVDFTNIDFYYASFGLIAPTGSIYTTNSNTEAGEFWYKAEGSDEWVSMELGDYGAFGMKQNCSVKDLRGWLAFDVSDLTLYSDSDNGLEGDGGVYPYDEVAGVYFYWDYAARTTAGTPIIIDEIGLVEDYTVFEEYAG